MEVPLDDTQTTLDPDKVREVGQIKTSIRSRLYWMCQIIGWTLWAFLSAQVKRIDHPVVKLDWEEILFYGSVGLLLTHMFRKIMHAWRTNQYDWKQVLVLSIAGAAFLGIVRTMISFGLYLFLTGSHQGFDLKAIILVDDTVSGVVVFFIWLMLYFSYHMWEGYHAVEARLWRIQSLLRATELKAFKAQVNPHFLFNSLNSLRSLVGDEPEKAREAIDAMAHILRYALKAGQAERVEFRYELETVKQYLCVEHIRFEEKLRVTYDIEPGVEDKSIPPMVIQTLVENAVKYGYQKEGIDIEISAKLGKYGVKPALIIKVRNHGELQGRELKVSDSTGMGLTITRERLAALGGSFELTEETREQQSYVVAILKVPV